MLPGLVILHKMWWLIYLWMCIRKTENQPVTGAARWELHSAALFLRVQWLNPALLLHVSAKTGVCWIVEKVEWPKKVILHLIYPRLRHYSGKHSHLWTLNDPTLWSLLVRHFSQYYLPNKCLKRLQNVMQQYISICNIFHSLPNNKTWHLLLLTALAKLLGCTWLDGVMVRMGLTPLVTRVPVSVRVCTFSLSSRIKTPQILSWRPSVVGSCKKGVTLVNIWHHLWLSNNIFLLLLFYIDEI